MSNPPSRDDFYLLFRLCLNGRLKCGSANDIWSNKVERLKAPSNAMAWTWEGIMKPSKDMYLFLVDVSF